MNGKTLLDKLWDSHTVDVQPDGTTLLYVDLHLVNEVTSPQAFEGLRVAGRKPWNTGSMLAVPDHNVPTSGRKGGIRDPISRLQVETLDRNCDELSIVRFDLLDRRHGILHVVSPEQGRTWPGMTIACGDSHTTTHGAFGALAFGIGTSEIEHILATQCLLMKKPKAFLVEVNGELRNGITAKDLILSIIGKIGTAGGTGYAIEFAGSTVRNLSMESRMTMCNMAIEAGARTGMVAVDDMTLAYLEGRPMIPKGAQWEQACAYWRTLGSDPDASFDRAIRIAAEDIRPVVTWGTSPEMVVDIHGRIPDPRLEDEPAKRAAMEQALQYMGLAPGTPIQDVFLDKVFIGSCTNARIEDLRVAAKVVQGKRIAKNIRLALVVPGSGLVKQQAEAEGLDRIFIDAGFEWREPGCSMCLGMNEDRLESGERCASTSNRNFEGRQGHGGRTHLVSPGMAAAAAIAGHFTEMD